LLFAVCAVSVLALGRPAFFIQARFRCESYSTFCFNFGNSCSVCSSLPASLLCPNGTKSPVGNRVSCLASSVGLIARLTNAFQGFQTGEGRPAGRNWIFGSCRVLDAKPSDIDQASYSSKPFLSITYVSFNLFTNIRNGNFIHLWGCLIEFLFLICRSKI
ncbi:hypothetical protein T4D_2203, partial [Trichinella pseudospiralis]